MIRVKLANRQKKPESIVIPLPAFVLSDPIHRQLSLPCATESV